MSREQSFPVVFQRLPNGAGLLVQQQPWAERVGVCLRVAAGSHDEPEQYPGLAHFLEHLLFLGSRAYPPEQGLMAYVQSRGGQVNASTQAHHTDFVFELPAVDLRPALARLLDMLWQPLLAERAQLAEREVLQAEYQARSQDSDARIDHALAQALPRGHRGSAFLAGDRHSLAVETPAFQQALLSFHRQHYQPSRMRLVLVGPQPPEHLQRVAEDMLGTVACESLPTGLAVVPEMLPLRATCLHLQHGSERVHLGQVLQVSEPGLKAAVSLLLDVLHDPAPGGLLDGLRRADLCRQLCARALYQHAGQCLLRIDFPGADIVHGGRLRATLQNWAAHIREADSWPLRLNEWRDARVLQQQNLAPLRAAQWLQEAPCERDEASTLRVLDDMLGQLASGEGAIELHCGLQIQPVWSAVGLDLRMTSIAPALSSSLHQAWQLPPGDVLLTRTLCKHPSLPMAQLRCLPGAGTGPAALHWRSDFSVPQCISEAGSSLLIRTADLRRRCERLGVMVQLDVHERGWLLALHGPAEILPACSAHLLPMLLAPLGEAPQVEEEGMLLRHLIGRLSVLSDTSAAEGLQGLAVGFEAADRQRFESLFGHVENLPNAQPLPPPEAGLQWREVEQPGSEAALLMFCPVPSDDASAEARWRLLGQHLQGEFYRRLRGELQLGYALFCGFRQIHGRRGLLFALQSPSCDVADIHAHIRAFLQAQREIIAALDDLRFRQLLESLQASLQPVQSNAGRAESLWQGFLAGLPDDHPQRLLQCLAAIKSVDLQAAHGQLLQAGGGWRVLASGPRPLL